MRVSVLTSRTVRLWSVLLLGVSEGVGVSTDQSDSQGVVSLTLGG